MPRVISANKGIDIAISINNQIIAGQKNAVLQQNTQILDISNQITKEWKRHIGGIKSWSVNCSGMVIKDQTSFNALENAYLNNSIIQVVVGDNDKKYMGNVIISSFPLSSSYDDTMLYNLVLQGTGGLTYVG